MKISDLIARLEKVKAESGDLELEVVHVSDDNCPISTYTKNALYITKSTGEDFGLKFEEETLVLW